MIKKVELQREEILLRPYQPNDADQLFKAVKESMTELSPWMPWCHSNYSPEESKIWIEERAKKWEQGVCYDFAIINSRDSLYLSGCGLNNIDPKDRIANLGYWVRSSRTKQGAATTAALLLAHFGIDKLKLNRIEIVIAAENQASQRVAEKVGAVREGLQRNRLILHGKVHDAIMFSIIPRDLIDGAR